MNINQAMMQLSDIFPSEISFSHGDYYGDSYSHEKISISKCHDIDELLMVFCRRHKFSSDEEIKKFLQNKIEILEKSKRFKSDVWIGYFLDEKCCTSFLIADLPDGARKITLARPRWSP